MDNEMMRKQFEEWWFNTFKYNASYNSKTQIYDGLVEPYAYAGFMAATDKLRDAVIILEDGEEPEVGDLVYNNDFGCAEVSDYGFEGEPCCIDINEDYHDLTGSKIIQRNGKPCIYQSALADKGENV